MKRFILLFTAIIFVSSINAQLNDKDLEKKVNDLLQKMTIEEKVGQMTQISLEFVTKPRKSNHDDAELDIKKVKEAVLKYHVGSFLNNGGAANSAKGWQKIIRQFQEIAVNESRLGIPIIYGIDAIHGSGYVKEATIFPQSIALAAARDPELVEEGAYITAKETRATGIVWNFNPVLGLGRNPVWPRFFETFGEDPYLATQLGRAYIRGTQGDDLSADDRVAACMKHYLGYSVPFNGLDRTPSWISERMIREYFLVPFAGAVEEGVVTTMVSSGEINGIPTHSDNHLLNEILKGELGFKGLVVSDWKDIKRLYERDRVAESPEEAVKMAVMAGLDMSMVPVDYSFYNILVKLVKEGEVPVSRIDDAVSRILKVKFLTGLFDNPFPKEELLDNIGKEEHVAASKKAAHEVITLLKNKNKVLPLDKSSKVLVTGPNANLMQVMNGGWTYTWQGNDESLYPKDKNTFLEAVQAKIGKDKVTYVKGTTFDTEVNIDKAVEAAKESDVVIAVLGEMPYCETPGNITNLELPIAQRNLVKEIAKLNKPIILVLFEGRPRIITDIVDLVDGIVMAYLPGNEGGDATADVIFGDYNPSGKLPFTYPRDVNGFTTYDYKPMEYYDENIVNPLFEFGTGLSYTNFEYSDLKLNKEVYSKDDEIHASINVKNIGDKDGKIVVELYLTDIIGSVSRPVKQLKRFKKIFLKAGEEKTLQFTLNQSDLSFIGRDNKRIIEPGLFEITIGDQKEKFHLK